MPGFTCFLPQYQCLSFSVVDALTNNEAPDRVELPIFHHHFIDVGMAGSSVLFNFYDVNLPLNCRLHHDGMRLQIKCQPFRCYYHLDGIKDPSLPTTMLLRHRFR